MKIIHTEKAPAALGPYAQAIHVGNMLFASGQIPITVAGTLVVDSIENATHRVFDNIEAILQEAGMQLKHVVKVTVFLKDLNDFDSMNTIYEARFKGHKPARSTLQVARLPKDVPIEIEIVAVN